MQHEQPPAPGWYPDPWAPGNQRWFDGSAWTAHAFPDQPGAEAAPPPEGVAATAGGAAPTPPDWVVPAAASVPSPPPPPVAAATASAARGARLAKGPAALLVVGAFVVALVATLVVTTRTARSAASPTTTTAPRRQTPSPSTRTPGTQAPGSGTPSTRAPGAATPPSTATGRAPTGGSGSAGGTTTTTPAQAAAAAALPDLVLQAPDVAADLDVATIPGGDSVAQGATLDLCNGTFASEALRVARLQVSASDTSGADLISTEAVAYRDAAATAQALAELRSVAAACPSTPVTSPVGEPTVTTTFGPAPDGSWPQVAGVDRLAFSITTTDSSGTEARSTAVYLRRGALLVGVYIPGGGAPTTAVDGQTTPAGIAGVFANRLAALPAATVAG